MVEIADFEAQITLGVKPEPYTTSTITHIELDKELC